MQADPPVRAFRSGFVALAIAAIVLQSCFVSKKYSRPEVIDQSLYRTDSLPVDSIPMGAMSWRDFFQDPVLSRHIETGLRENIDIRTALRQIAAASAYVKQGNAAFLPTLNVQGRVNYQELSRNSQFGSFFDGAITQYDITAGMSWEADIWGRIRSNKRAFEASYLQTIAAHQAVKTNVVSGIATLYLQLLALDEQLRLTRETVATRERSLVTTRALKQAGAVTEVAVQQTEAQLHNARALEVDLGLNIRLVENALSILMGQQPAPVDRGNLSDLGIPDSISAGVPIQLLRNRPDIIASELALVNTFELENAARASFYPTITLTGSGGLQSLEFDKLFSVNSLFANLVGGIAQPILNGRRIRTQYEVAIVAREQAFLGFRQSILTASREVSDAIYNFEAARKSVDIRALEAAALDTATVYSEELLNSGLANYLEVLTAQQNSLNAQLGVIRARQARYAAVIELYRALGGGWR